MPLRMSSRHDPSYFCPLAHCSTHSINNSEAMCAPTPQSAPDFVVRQVPVRPLHPPTPRATRQPTLGPLALSLPSIVGGTDFVSWVRFNAKCDGCVPHTQDGELRIVGQPE